MLQEVLEDTKSDDVESESDRKPSWWSNLPFWREEQSTVDAAEAEAKREAPSMTLYSLARQIYPSKAQVERTKCPHYPEFEGAASE